jgi:hypothetical protein
MAVGFAVKEVTVGIAGLTVTVQLFDVTFDPSVE